MMKLMALLVFCFATAVTAQVVPADGLWRTSDDPDVGSGVAIFTQGSQTLVSVFTYSGSGDSRWYTAAGQIDADGVFEARLLETQQGSYITAENPVTANFITTERHIRLVFDGSQTGTLSIDDSPPKAMQAFHFGTRLWPTQQWLLADESPYLIPHLEGQWVLGNTQTGQSHLLTLVHDVANTTASPPLPNSGLSYTSTHPSTDGWKVTCAITASQTLDPFCRLFNPTDELLDMKILPRNLGNEKFILFQKVGDQVDQWEAFRLSKDKRVLPSDGLWRTVDDPAVGSGLVMRTQGKYTMVLLYSYDESGQATWGIASGQIDETGTLVADLLKTTGGDGIQSAQPQTASYTAQRKSLELKFSGTELGTLRIDDSARKTIQQHKFGVALNKTVHFDVDGQPYQYPSQYGHWLLVNETRDSSIVMNLVYENPNCCQSPPDPYYYDSVPYINDQNLDVSYLWYNCLKGPVDFFGSTAALRPYCYGYDIYQGSNALVKLYYHDLGVNKFRYYIGPRYEQIDRDSNYFQLYRMASNLSSSSR